ncbi:Do family serine endopeptidase [Methyloraptor flagellatus]|uniref:Probable periplasmic serine endoprotease DegP-like n=1 Tax=Methyloraptor flagellatus TaxID=3162530 RepID=A0AAU7X620_9HYPH
MAQIDPVSPAKAAAAKRRKALLAGFVTLGLVGSFAAEALVAHVAPANAQTTAPAVGPNIANFSFAGIVDKVRPAVVSIRVKAEAQASGESMMDAFPDVPEGSPLEKFFREFGAPNGPGGPGMRGMRPPRGGGAAPVMSQGSGFIISPDGKVVTNFHVVKGATEVTVLMDDGNEYKAKVLGSDEKTDIALVQIQGDKKDFPTVPFSNGDIKVGDWVLAVGNPFGLGGSVTAGILSARGREIGAGPYDDFLQIDAPINRGNSGGPTFNLAGEVVGVNTAIYSPSGGSVGIGFAIPSDTVQKVIAQLEKNGTVVRGWLGVQIQPVNRDVADSLGLKEARGALVAEAQADSPALKAGLKNGDAILAVEGKPIKGPRELARTIAGYEPGSTVKITIVRAGREQVVPVALGKMPGEMKQAKAGGAEQEEKHQTSLADLGMYVAPASDVGEGDRGVVVVRIDPRGAAASRGIQQGDVILEAQGKQVSTASDVTSAIREAKSEGRKAVLLRVKSGETSRYVPLPLAAS